MFFDNLQVTHIRGPMLEETHYYPFGLIMQGISSKALSFGNPENKKKYQGYEYNTDFDINLYETFFRSHDPQLGRFWQIDPKPNYDESLYAAMGNNPILKNDPLGDTTVVDRRGNVVKQYGTDNLIFLQKGKKLKQIGEFGKSIDGNKIIRNMLKANSATAKGIYNPVTFYNLVKNKGDWDLKNNTNTIFGLANKFDALNKTKTQFEYEGSKMTAEDVGNFHFGVVGKATGLFPEEVMLRQAGAAQISGGTSKPEWQKYGTIEVNAGRGETRTVPGPMLPPYGDDPRDQDMIIKGFNYYSNNKAELKKPEED